MSITITRSLGPNSNATLTTQLTPEEIRQAAEEYETERDKEQIAKAIDTWLSVNHFPCELSSAQDVRMAIPRITKLFQTLRRDDVPIKETIATAINAGLLPAVRAACYAGYVDRIPNPAMRVPQEIFANMPVDELRSLMRRSVWKN